MAERERRGRAMAKDPKGFDTDQVSQILALYGTALADSISSDLQQPIEHAVRQFVQGHPLIAMEGLKNVGMSNVMLRTEGLSIWLDAVLSLLRRLMASLHVILKTDDRSRLEQLPTLTQWAQVPDKIIPFSHDGAAPNKVAETLHSCLLYRSGAFWGFTFSVDAIGYLRSRDSWDINGAIPFTYNALLGFWTSFDQASNMGRFSVAEGIKDTSEEEAQLAVTVEDSFLTRDHGAGESMRHRHCAFMRGYLRGTIDGLFLQWAKWIRGTQFLRRPKLDYEVASCAEVGTDDKCFFQLTLRPEERPAVRSALAKAIEEYREQKSPIIKCRSAVERAFIHLVAPDGPEPILKFAGLLGVLRESGVQLPYQEVQDFYADLSALAAHPSSDASVVPEDRVRRILATTWWTVNQVPPVLIASQQVALAKAKGKWCSGERKVSGR
jgi:hypothetical protein